MTSIPSLKQELDCLESSSTELNDRISAKRKELAAAIAVEKGAVVGSIVVSRDSRYSVTSIHLHPWASGELKLHGAMIRKDGSLGVVREIWGGWELAVSK